jgi:hypothetical protein
MWVGLMLWMEILITWSTTSEASARWWAIQPRWRWIGHWGVTIYVMDVLIRILMRPVSKNVVGWRRTRWMLVVSWPWVGIRRLWAGHGSSIVLI